MNVSKLLLSLSVLFTSSLTCHRGHAGTEGDVDYLLDLPLDALLNIEFRRSLVRARQSKRDALIVSEHIIGEDIADFPGLNLAESLQLLPGVTINREGGEGRQIALRGIGPDFTTVSINGMESHATSSSPMDSRGQVVRRRRFDFNVFAANFIGSIEIKKSYSAKDEEGGIGGHVDLRTPTPFDTGDHRLAFSAFFGTNQYNSKVRPRVTALYSNTWDDTFGLLASASFGERNIVEQGYDTFRWRQRTVATGNYNANTIDEATAAQLESGAIWFARGNRLSYWQNRQQRASLNLTMEYKKADTFNATLYVLQSLLENNRDEWHLATAGSSLTALGRVEALETINNNGDIEAVSARFSNTPLRAESRADEADTDYQQVSFKASWTPLPGLTLSTQAGHSSSEYDQPLHDKAFFQTINGVGFSSNFVNDRFLGQNSYDTDVTDTSNWGTFRLDLREDYIDIDYDSIKLNAAYDINDRGTIDIGTTYKAYTNDGTTYFSRYVIANDTTPANSGNTNIDDRFFVFQEMSGQSWLATDVDAMRRFYALPDTLMPEDAPSNTPFDISEKTTSVYAQYTLKKPFSLSVGLRYYKTKVDLDSLYVNESLIGFDEGEYSGWLPALNINYPLTDSLQLRFAASRNITRPFIDIDLQLAPSINTGRQTLEIGNANLEPYTARNFDLGVEWYFDTVSYLAFTLFHKRVKNFTDQLTLTMPFGDTGVSTRFLPDGQNANTAYQVSQPVNSAKTTIKGAELALHLEFDFLPEPFNTLGSIINLTAVDGDAFYDDVQASGLSELKTLQDLSKNANSLILYYHTGPWGFNITSAYRDRYISEVEAGLSDEDERGFHATRYTNAALSYKVSKKMKLSLEGVNLSNEREEQYSDSNDRPYNTTTSGRTYFLGIHYRL